MMSKCRNNEERVGQIIENNRWRKIDLAGFPAFLLQTEPPAESECLIELTRAAGGWLPGDYIEVMSRMDGFNGIVGATVEEGSWLCLLPCRAAIAASPRISN
jgi:hypothetical protein